MSPGYVREFDMSALAVQPLLESSPQGTALIVPSRSARRRKGCMPAYSQAVGQVRAWRLIVPGRAIMT
jgi:hypothetical protein